MKTNNHEEVSYGLSLYVQKFCLCKHSSLITDTGTSRATSHSKHNRLQAAQHASTFVKKH